MWVLIIMLSSQLGVSAASVEFADERACLAAKEHIVSVEPDSASAICTPKAIPPKPTFEQFMKQ